MFLNHLSRKADEDSSYQRDETGDRVATRELVTEFEIESTQFELAIGQGEYQEEVYFI